MTGGAKGRGDQGRILIVQAVFMGLFLLLLYRLYDLQIINGQAYAEDFELKITRTVRDKSTRGSIYDRNGELLAYDQLVYTVTMTDNGTYASDRERSLALNSMIYHVARELRERQEQICNDLKIRVGAGGHFEYTVSGAALVRFKADIFGKADPADMTLDQKEMDADEMIRYLSSNDRFALYGEGKRDHSDREREDYGLPQAFSAEETLTIVGIRYMLSLNAYKKYVPIVLARDVSKETVAYIMENAQTLTGISIEEDWKRVYAGGSAFSHILGYTGKISSEELEQYAGLEKDYTSDSVVGKAGIEQYLEEQLHGIDGERQITVDNLGRIVGEDEVIRQMESGQDVYLTIDKDLQTAVYGILEQELAGIVAGSLIDAKRFDKKGITDTTKIRIPVYDVYLALVKNDVIRLEELHDPDATLLEQSLAARLGTKKQDVIRAVTGALQEDTDHSLLSEELQGYLAYIAGDMELVDPEAVDKESDAYAAWKSRRGISAKGYLTAAIENGWIRAGILDAQQGYFTTDEMYAMLVEAIRERMESDQGFEELLFAQMILEDTVTGREVCMLLYDQEVLMDADEDYERLAAGRMDAYAFIKKKIGQLEITPAQLALDPCAASAVVVEPQTGKVLALVSYPGYDNNRLADRMDPGYYDQLLKDRSLPLYNRATQQLTAPGSTLKPITIIAGLQEGIIAPDSSLLCDGVFDKVAPSLRCWKHSGHGMVTDAPTALQFSCNDYMCVNIIPLGSHQFPASEPPGNFFLESHLRHKI